MEEGNEDDDDHVLRDKLRIVGEVKRSMVAVKVHFEVLEIEHALQVLPEAIIIPPDPVISFLSK